MAQLAERSEESLINELKGIIFFNPENQQWENNDEYLSGNVREKLAVAKKYALSEPKYQENVEALKEIQPKDLEASEIEVRIGATWLKPEIYEQFMQEIFHTPQYHFHNNRLRCIFHRLQGNGV